MRHSLSAAIAACALATTLAAHAQPVPFPTDPFKDVKTTHVNYQAIEYLRENKVVRGYLDGTFRADTRISRAEFVTLLTNPYFIKGQRDNDCLRAHYGSGTTAVFYRDVRAQEWYAQDVCFATVNGIINGYPDGSFGPNHSITFVEAAKIAANVLSLKVRKDSTGDVHWYTAYVQRLAELKAIPRTIHRLDQTLTRGEMAEISYRLKANVTTKASMRWEDFN